MKILKTLPGIGISLVIAILALWIESLFPIHIIGASVIAMFIGNDVVGTYLDFVTKYVLWDDVLDWERDIKDYGKKKEEVKGQRRLI